MRIKELTWRNRNDFHFIADCDCGKSSRWGDGYADEYYQLEVFPNRKCPHCGRSEVDGPRKPVSEMTREEAMQELADETQRLGLE